MEDRVNGLARFNLQQFAEIQGAYSMYVSHRLLTVPSLYAALNAYQLPPQRVGLMRVEQFVYFKDNEFDRDPANDEILTHPPEQLPNHYELPQDGTVNRFVTLFITQ